MHHWNPQACQSTVSYCDALRLLLYRRVASGPPSFGDVGPDVPHWPGGTSADIGVQANGRDEREERERLVVAAAGHGDKSGSHHIMLVQGTS